jgi:hypothetical protein
MYRTKRDLLRGYERIVQGDNLHCIALIPDNLVPSVQIDFEYRHRHFYVDVAIDRLLSRWLKLDKYFDIAGGEWRVCAFLFLQPIWDNVFTMSRYSSWTYSPNQQSLESPRWIFEMTYSNLRRNSQSAIHVQLSLPFLFVQNMYRSDFDLRQSDLVCTRQRQDLPFKLVPTKNNSSIYIMIFSNVLKTEKDCAKLLRLYLKNPQDLGGQYFLFGMRCSTMNIRLASIHQYYFFDPPPGGQDLTGAVDSFSQHVYGDDFAQRVYDDGHVSFMDAL